MSIGVIVLENITIRNINEDRLSLPNPRDAMHHGNVLQTNKVDVQCDKLSTVLR